MPSFRVGIAILLTDAGRADEARPVLRDLVQHADQLPFDWSWLQSMFLSALLAARLEDPDAAQRVYELLHPYAGLVANGGATMLGPIDHALGVAAVTSGRWTTAIGTLAPQPRSSSSTGCAGGRPSRRRPGTTAAATAPDHWLDVVQNVAVARRSWIGVEGATHDAG